MLLMLSGRLAPVCALLALGVVGASGSAAPPPCTQLAFSSDRGRNIDIYVIGANGKGLRRLTTSPAADRSPVWAPGGGKIAFRSDRDSSDDVYVMNADGTDQTNLTNNPGEDYSPTWSPDGSQIAFAHSPLNPDPDLNDIWVMNADGSEPHQLTRRVGIDEYPIWSPDGTKIAFACTNGVTLGSRIGDFEVCVMNADGSDVRRVTNAPGTSMAYSWSPDSRSIAFASSRKDRPGRTSEGGDIYTMNADGTRVVRITRGPAYDSQPAWACDGGRFAYLSDGARGNVDLYLMTVRGKRIARLTRSRAEDADPSWRP